MNPCTKYVIHSRTRYKEKLLNVNRDVAATWQTSWSFDRDSKNSEIRPENRVLTLRLKRSSKVSSKVLKTIYWLPRYIFIYMLRNLDFKNIFLWLGFSHFFAMLYFFSFFFAYETDVIWKRMHPPRGMESSLCTCSQNSGRCTCMPRGMLIEVRFTPPGPSDWRGKKTTKENIKKKIKELASS